MAGPATTTATVPAASLNGSSSVNTSKLSKGQLKKLKAKTKKQQGGGSTATTTSNGTTSATATAAADDADKENDAAVASSSSAAANGVTVKREEPDTGSRIGQTSSTGNMYDDAMDEEEEKKPSTSALEDADSSMSMPEEFRAIMAKFQAVDDVKVKGEVDEETGKGHVYYSDDEGLSEEDEAAAAAAAQESGKKRKKASRLSVAELKRLVKKPEVVDWVDVTAQDPRLLVHLKSYRNTIPVPGHWSSKRDYLAGKKGIEKPPFQLPDFIADTGIATQRDAIKEKEEGQSLKQKQRERVQPKMGKIDIDYQKLHDAFFKFQTKPPMSRFGEMYYEGKEFETHLKEKKPGDLSKELKEALSIPPLAPPPWLIAMQRFGPPPSYPNLRIPGLNAPIPEGAQWGFHPGGWGKPPVDEFNRPLYGDVFGVAVPQEGEENYVDKTLWGELEPDQEDSDEEEEEEEEEEEDEEQPTPADGMQTPSTMAQGMETPSGFQSVASTVPGGIETPDFLELRKRRETTTDTEMDAGGPPRQLYQVLPEQQTAVRGFLGSERGYDTRNIGTGNVPILGVDDGRSSSKRKNAQGGGVDLSIDAAELEGLSESELKARFEAAKQASGGGGAGQGGREDLSDFVAEEAAKRRKMAEAKSARKQKDNFKF